MEKLIKALLVITVIASFSTGCMKRRPRSKIDLVSEEICSRFIEIMKEKCPELRPNATGGGVKDGKIMLISVVFRDDHPITLLQARSYIVTCGIEMEKIILENPEYLKFFEPDISPIVTFNHAILAPRSESYPQCSIVQTGMYNGFVGYSISQLEECCSPFLNEDEPFYGTTRIGRESFEEARLLVQEQQKCIDEQ
ncbi:MAG: hypothetical protein S4CHLAM81_11310 [Chlamydiales bacterium]|nr:hypothetical protein [Chlamydiales bacterium]MCH9635909.1 hypothetical protein [Chlamydiales bacterium]